MSADISATTKPRVLFFARGYQADFFPRLTSDRYEAVFVTLTRAEQRIVQSRGGQVAACFEEQFDALTAVEVPDGYLGTSLVSDRFLGRFDYADRREILGKEIAFWGGLLDTYRPAAVVNELVAIEISEVLLIEARRRDIPYLAGMDCLVEGRSYWLKDPLTLTGANITPCDTPAAETLAMARSYLERLRQPRYRPYYVRDLAGRRALRPVLAALVKSLAWRARIRFGRRFQYEDYREEYAKRISVFLRSFRSRYDRIANLPAEAEVIFYPLHQEPEATLAYMSEFYANQVHTIENILKCLSPGQVLVVKEHPVDKGSLLRDKFQALRKRLSGLYYLPAELHGRDVLTRAARVVTLTSSVGWEAANDGRPVYVMGRIFFDRVAGITRIRSFRELRAALRVPLAEAPRADPAAIERLVVGMTAMSWPGNPFPHAHLNSAENIRLVVDAVERGAGLA